MMLAWQSRFGRLSQLVKTFLCGHWSCQGELGLSVQMAFRCGLGSTQHPSKQSQSWDLGTPGACGKCRLTPGCGWKLLPVFTAGGQRYQTFRAVAWLPRKIPLLFLLKPYLMVLKHEVYFPPALPPHSEIAASAFLV